MIEEMQITLRKVMFWQEDMIWKVVVQIHLGKNIWFKKQHALPPFSWLGFLLDGVTVILKFFVSLPEQNDLS